mgnify:CR=1 FL=1
MTTTLITSPDTDRARLFVAQSGEASTHVVASHPSVARSTDRQTSVFAVPMFAKPICAVSTFAGTGTTDAANLWLGGASEGGTSEYGIKRILPGRLDAVT